MRPSISFGLSALALALSAAAMARTDTNSFVNRKVTNTNSLIGQIKSDPEVSDRYQRHFAMSRQELVAYLSNLHRGTLSEEGSYTVYSVPDNGRVKMHVEKLKKGEPMFMNPAGQPILIVKCGNPVVLGPSRRRGNPVVVTTTEPNGSRELVLEAPRPVEDYTATQLVALMPPVPPVVDAPPFVPAPPVEPPVATVPATATGGGGRFPWFLGLPLLFPIFDNGHGGGGGGTESVPEPATVAVLSVGAIGLMRRRRKA